MVLGHQLVEFLAGVKIIPSPLDLDFDRGLELLPGLLRLALPATELLLGVAGCVRVRFGLLAAGFN